MTTDLRERLAALAEEAGQAPAHPADLWARGRAYARRRALQLTGLVAATLLVLGFAGTSAFEVLRPRPAPVMSGDSEVRVPDALYTPSPWLRTTSADGPPGLLVALVGGERRTLFDSRMGVYGVSATTGDYTWLELPGLDDTAPVSLSPDGTRVAYWLERPGAAPGGSGLVDGYAVYDTVSGELDRHPVASELGLSADGVAWTPGEAWFRFSRVTELRDDGWSAGGVPLEVVDLTAGSVTRIPLSRAPSFDEGALSAAAGFVADASRERSRLWVPGPDGASWQEFTLGAMLQGSPVPSPDGRLLAGIEETSPGECCSGGPIRIGTRTGDRVRWHTIPGDYDHVWGWRDGDHVLAQRRGDGTGVLVGVDVRTGATEELIGLPESNLRQAPALAGGLLSGPVVAAEQPTAGDQRALVGRSVAALLAGGLLLRVLLRWRPRVRT